MISMKKRALGHETEPPCRVMDAVHRESCIEATAATASDRTMKKNIRGWRRKAAVNYPEPKTLDDISVPPNLQLTQRGERFLLFDTADGDQRIICFSTTANIQEIQSCETIILDGTFDIAPQLFSQVYILHTSHNGMVLPYIYGLLTNKTRTYKKFLSSLKQAAPSFSLNGKVVIVDYELGAIQAIKKTFPESIVQGCLFHLQRCVYRHVPSQLDKRYRADPYVEVKVRSLSALAFLSTSEVPGVFQILRDGIDDNDVDLINLYAYFKRNYIGCVTEPARFPVDLWNVYNRTLLQVPRTTHSAEAFHRKMQNKAPGSHPPLWTFIDILRNEQSDTERRIEKCTIPSNRPSKKPRYETLDENLHKLVSRYSVDYSANDKVKFVRGCAYSLAQNKRKQNDCTIDGRMPRLTPNFDALTQQLTPSVFLTSLYSFSISPL